MAKFKLSESCQIGEEFFHFVWEHYGAAVTDRSELKNIYIFVFRSRNPAAKLPDFSTILYALRTYGKVTIQEGQIHFTDAAVSLDQWHSPRSRWPTPGQNGAASLRAIPAISSGEQTRIRGRAQRIPKADSALILLNTDSIRITSDHEFDGDGKLYIEVTAEKEQRVVNLHVQNIGTEAVYFYCTPVGQWPREFTLKAENVTKENPLRLRRGDRPGIQVHIRRSVVGFCPAKLAFEFKPDPQSSSAAFRIVRLIEVQYITDLGRELKAVAPYKRPNWPDQTPKADWKIKNGKKPERQSDMNLKNERKLEDYRIPEFVTRLIHLLKQKSTYAADKRIAVLKSPLSWEKYAEKFHLLLHLEEFQMEVDIQQYNIPNSEKEYAIMMREPKNKELLTVEISGVSENRPSVIKGDSILAYPAGEKGVDRGFVHSVEQDKVKLSFSSELLGRSIEDMKFHIEFTVNRLTLCLQHRAVDLAAKYSLGNVLFPAAPANSSQPTQLPKLRLFNLDLANNQEQYQAVQHIVAGSSKPAPYLVFGPPGTGKTVTLVEAIKQIEKNQASCHILACAHCNSAADLLCQKIVHKADRHQVYRMYALSLNPKSVPDDLKTCSNLVRDHFCCPDKEKLMEYKIIVTTLFTAGRLVTGGIPTGHFTHVFVDEAGQAAEPECLIPLAGLLNAKTGQVVLAGDPKQLGPILRSPNAQKYGLEVSLLERLMEDTLYQKDKGVFNNRFVTKLLKNYRSHPAILKVPNELFYDGELQCCAEEEMSTFCKWKGLKKEGFPVIFRAVNGIDEREASSPSFFNRTEVETLMEYVKVLLLSGGKNGLPKISPENIGIIAPYRKQVEKIRKGLKKVEKDHKLKDMNALKVGSVEEFQGEEREVILVSTVRSSHNYLNEDEKFNLGFVKNKKRFNVAVTRAKALLIVVGNPRVLNKDPTWNDFIKHCQNNGGYDNSNCVKDDDDDDDDVAKSLKALCISDD